MTDLNLVEKVLGSGYHKSGENYAFACPFCGHPKHKLEFDLKSQKWHCWVCDAKGNSLYALAKKVGTPVEVLKIIPGRPKKTYQVSRTYTGSLGLPTNCKNTWEDDGSFFFKKADAYLRSRKVGVQDRIKHNLMYTEMGRTDSQIYKNMIIVPNYDEKGILNFYTGRSYLPGNDKLSPSVSKDIIGFESLLNFEEPLIIVEGAFDAVAVKINATPLYGSFVSKKLKEKVIIHRTPVYVCLDGEAQKAAIDAMSYFLGNGIEVYHTVLPDGEDPSKLGFNSVWKYIENSTKVDKKYLHSMTLENKHDKKNKKQPWYKEVHF